MDRLNDVTAFYNGGVNHCSGRNLAPNGCNLGLQYQCVEFVKRYYYEHLHHEMPDSFGHAREFFNAAVADGSRNPQRNLIQHVNGSHSRPRPDDLLVFGPSFWNAYGHVAIVAAVTDSKVEIVQQNPGPFTSSRESLPLSCINGLWSYDNERVLGWLCKEEPSKGL
ncbi:MAG: bifunctional glutathionylspermidine amidase/glutathionylspermidine synthetase [Verrucomicrobiaceae bacterium]|nr:bifunctional glutathionylspermidine amidase/glutathionylspermidine synthetase [Verrucomicrobiaceae bacterium]